VATTVVAFVAALGFGVLAVHYRGGSVPGLVDARLRERLGSVLHAYRGLLDVVTYLGDPGPVALVAAVLAAYAVWMGRSRLAALALTAPVVTGLLTTAAKWVVGRTLHGDLSLPSGHTAAVTSLGVVAALLHLARRHRSSIAPVVDLLLVTALAATMSAALVAAGVHYATDTIAGYLAALACTLFVARLLDALCERRARRRGVRAEEAAVTDMRATAQGGAR
jgi:undecaprenyl-diphosphatase